MYSFNCHATARSVSLDVLDLGREVIYKPAGCVVGGAADVLIPTEHRRLRSPQVRGRVFCAVCLLLTPVQLELSASGGYPLAQLF